jgi:1,4-dihydroxy-2-naphthoyl-CoA hydrolase
MPDSTAATPYATLADHTAAAFNRFGAGHLPGHLGIEILSVEPQRLVCRAPIRPELMAPNGFLHGGTLVVLGDTLCGYGCVVNLPPGAIGFATIELKTNFLGTAREGILICEAVPVHLGRNTQVWDATVTHEATQRPLAKFRCTQMVLWKT